MKILLISASPRKEKSQTFLLAKEVLRSCNNDGVTSEIVHLANLKIDFCRACEVCHKKILSCPIKDDVRMVLDKMLEADGIILASPNYINQVTASMKALFDRSSHFIHCLRLEGKYIAGVVSSGSGQDKDVLDYIKHYAHVCGAQYAGGVSCRAPAKEDDLKKAFKLGAGLYSTVKRKKSFPDQVKIIGQRKEHFKNLIKMRQHHWKGEYRYWLTKGWL